MKLYKDRMSVEEGEEEEEWRLSLQKRQMSLHVINLTSLRDMRTAKIPFINRINDQKEKSGLCVKLIKYQILAVQRENSLKRAVQRIIVVIFQ